MIMRLYISDQKIQHNFNKEDFPCNIEDKFISVYTLEGIFEIQNGRFYKLIIDDKPCYSDKISIIPVKCDTTSIKRTSDVSYLPYNNITLEITQTKFMLRQQSKIYLVLEQTKTKIIDMYFETKEDPHNPVIEEDLVTLYSILNKS